MPEHWKVFVYSEDPILHAGTVAQLRGAQRITVTDDLDEAEVAVVVADDVDESTLRLCRSLRSSGSVGVVLMGAHLNDPELVAAVRAGASGLLRRSSVVPGSLVTAIAAVASGRGWLPEDLIGSLMSHVSQMTDTGPSHRRLNLSGFTERELQVLRLVAAGQETAEIARTLCYSERTVKGVIHEITSRFQLKNRAEAVAYAVRQGVI